MLFTTRDVTVPLYEAPPFIKSNQIQTYLNVVLVTILVHDSRMSSFDTTLPSFGDVLPVCTFDKEVCP